MQTTKGQWTSLVAALPYGHSDHLVFSCLESHRHFGRCQSLAGSPSLDVWSVPPAVRTLVLQVDRQVPVEDVPVSESIWLLTSHYRLPLFNIQYHHRGAFKNRYSQQQPDFEIAPCPVSGMIHAVAPVKYS